MDSFRLDRVGFIGHIVGYQGEWMILPALPLQWLIQIVVLSRSRFEETKTGNDLESHEIPVFVVGCRSFRTSNCAQQPNVEVAVHLSEQTNRPIEGPDRHWWLEIAVVLAIEDICVAAGSKSVSSAKRRNAED